MQRFNNTYTNRMNGMNRPQMMPDTGDWSGEINGGGTSANAQWSGGQDMSRPGSRQTAGGDMMYNGNADYGIANDRMGNGDMMNNGGMMFGNELSDSMRNHLDSDVVETPTTMEEAYRGSLKKFLADNKGNFVVATFLIGTQGTAEFEGILYEVGNDYMVIYQEGRDRYIVVDIYSLKYIEFYDTEKRRLCNDLLRQQGMWPLPNRPEYA